MPKNKEGNLREVVLSRKLGELWEKTEKLLSANCDVSAVISMMKDGMRDVRYGRISAERLVIGMVEQIDVLDRAIDKVRDFYDRFEADMKALNMNGIYVLTEKRQNG